METYFPNLGGLTPKPLPKNLDERVWGNVFATYCTSALPMCVAMVAQRFSMLAARAFLGRGTKTIPPAGAKHAANTAGGGGFGPNQPHRKCLQGFQGEQVDVFGIECDTLTDNLNLFHCQAHNSVYSFMKYIFTIYITWVKTSTQKALPDFNKIWSWWNSNK